jgi:hypothetical protein
VDINSERLNKLGNYCGRTKELTDDELRSETSHITDCLFAKKATQSTEKFNFSHQMHKFWSLNHSSLLELNRLVDNLLKAIIGKENDLQ